MQYDRGAELVGHVRDLRVAQVRAQLRQVGAMKRASVQVDEHIAVCDDFSEERMRDSACGAAGWIAREEAVQVATIGQVARAPAKPLQVHDRHSDYGAGQPLRIQVVEYPANDLDSVQFVAVHG